MAGTFTVGETKIRPGVYHRRENVGGVSQAGAVNGIGAGLIRANWGPLNQVVDFDSSTNVREIFGSGMTEDLISEMFAGGIVSGKFVRVGKGGSAPKIKLEDVAGEEVLEITGAYVGNRAFTLSIRSSLTGGRECIIYDGETECLKVGFTTGGNEAKRLAEAINAGAQDFSATLLESEEATLADVTQKAFEGGQNPTVSAEDYSVGLSALEATVYNVLCVDTEEAPVHALVAAFLDRTYLTGSFPMACLAEKSSVSLETRMSHAAAFNNEKIVYCLNGAYDSRENKYDGYKLAARIGGMVASVASNTSLTHTPVPGFAQLAEALTNSQVEQALKKGCLVLTKNSSGQVWIEQAVNTLITPAGELDEGWKKIRRVKTRFELMQRVIDTIEPLIGTVNNDSDGRAAVVAAGQGVINNMVGEKKLLDGSAMYEDPGKPAQGDSAWFVLAVDDIDSIEKVYLTFQFRFSGE